MSELTRVDELLNRWEEMEQRGEHVSVDLLCAEYPDLREIITERVAGHRSAEGGLADDEATTVTTCSSAAQRQAITASSTLGLLRYIDGGGLGVVFRARDRALDREVAVKFMRGSLAQHEDLRAQFALEAEITGKLAHPGIVPVYGIGQTGGERLFYVMRLIEGRSFEQAIAEHYGSAKAEGTSVQKRLAPESALTFHDLLNRFVSVCKTIAYAHNRGIVHRDIKPGNVMLGRFGETLVVDWGLAAPFRRHALFQQSGEETLALPPDRQSGSSASGGGTPAYMSPEQMSNLLPTPVGDVYSLGAMLYHLLTGEPPFRGTFPLIHDRVLHGEFVAPRSVRPTVPGALEAICLKAMSLHAHDRYQTALELADDIERYLADEPVSVYPESAGGRLVRWVRQHRSSATAAAVASGLVLVISVASAIGMAGLAASERRQRAVALRAEELAEAGRRSALRFAAESAASAFARQIDLRWRILEFEASSPMLRERLARCVESPADRSRYELVQSWLESRRQAGENAVSALSWLVMVHDGTQVARVPYGSSVGENYRYRDYYHGLGYDLAKDDPRLASLRPLMNRTTHMSRVFTSTVSGTLMVAFSVPIYDQPPESASRKRIGVLAMTVELGEFRLPERCMLVDTREDLLLGSANRGLVMHHASLQRASSAPREAGQRSWPRIQADLVEQVRLSSDRELARRTQPSAESGDDEHVISDFHDPLAPEQPAVLAAWQPVLVEGRPSESAQTGWCVIVTGQRPEDPRHPGQPLGAQDQVDRKH